MKPHVVGLLLGGVLGLFATVGGIVTLDAFAAYQERESYVALVEQRDSLEQEVELCRIATNRIAGRLSSIERVMGRRR